MQKLLLLDLCNHPQLAGLQDQHSLAYFPAYILRSSEVLLQFFSRLEILWEIWAKVLFNRKYSQFRKLQRLTDSVLASFKLFHWGDFGVFEHQLWYYSDNKQTFSFSRLLFIAFSHGLLLFLCSALSAFGLFLCLGYCNLFRFYYNNKLFERYAINKSG